MVLVFDIGFGDLFKVRKSQVDLLVLWNKPVNLGVTPTSQSDGDIFRTLRVPFSAWPESFEFYFFETHGRNAAIVVMIAPHGHVKLPSSLVLVWLGQSNPCRVESLGCGSEV